MELAHLAPLDGENLLALLQGLGQDVPICLTLLLNVLVQLSGSLILLNKQIQDECSQVVHKRVNVFALRQTLLVVGRIQAIRKKLDQSLLEKQGSG